MIIVVDRPTILYQRYKKLLKQHRSYLGMCFEESLFDNGLNCTSCKYYSFENDMHVCRVSNSGIFTCNLDSEPCYSYDFNTDMCKSKFQLF